MEKSYNIYLKISEQYANIKSQITINSKTNTITICDCDIAIKNINKGDEIYRTYCVEWLYKLFKNITFDKYISYISNDKTKVNKYRDILENNFMYMQNYFVPLKLSHRYWKRPLKSRSVCRKSLDW